MRFGENLLLNFRKKKPKQSVFLCNFLAEFSFSVMFQYCYSTVAVLLQYCCSIVTVLLQYCYSTVTVLLLVHRKNRHNRRANIRGRYFT
jgi:hypothetical protein